MDRTTSAPESSRRWPLFVSLTALIVAATVAVVSVTRSDELPVIRLSSGGSAEMAATARDDAAMEPAYALVNRFVLTDTALFPAGEATAYRLEPPDDLEGAAAALAGRLGLSTDVELSQFGDGAYQVGADDGSGPSLWVGPSGDWSFNDPTGQPQVRCIEPDGGGSPGDPGEPGNAAAPPEDGIATEPAVPEDGGEPVDVDEPADVDEPSGRELPDEDLVAPCDPVAPPTGIPDESAAREAAEAFLGGLELPGQPRITDVYADEWGAWVSATMQFDAVDSNLSVGVGFGQDALVTSASATLARPVEAGPYPTIDAQAAVDRMESQQAWPGVMLDLPMGRPTSDVSTATGEARATDVDPDTPVESPAQDTPGQSMTDEPVEPPSDVDMGDGDDVSILPVPEPDAEPEVRTVTLVSAEPTVMMTVDADGLVWLLPGVRFSDEDGVVWQVVTVADDYLEEASDTQPTPMPVEPGGDPDGKAPGELVDPDPGQAGGQAPGREPDEGPVPVEPDPGQPDTDVQALAEAVVGLAETDAVERIRSAGFEPRVVARDGEALVVTDDLRQDRINLHVEGAKIVEASVG